MNEICRALSFETKIEGNQLLVSVPNRRMDISIKQDLVEEIARIYGYDKLNDTISFDEEKAKKILDDAKIVDSNKDGYRELDGKNIELNFLTYDSRNLTDFAEGVALQLEKIGIRWKSIWILR